MNLRCRRFSGSESLSSTASQTPCRYCRSLLTAHGAEPGVDSRHRHLPTPRENIPTATLCHHQLCLSGTRLFSFAEAAPISPKAFLFVDLSFPHYPPLSLLLCPPSLCLLFLFVLLPLHMVPSHFLPCFRPFLVLQTK